MPRFKWTRDRILLEIRRLAARGERLSTRRMSAIGLGGMVTAAYALFGTWRKAIDESGVDAPRSRARHWTVERITIEIRRMVAEGEDVSHSGARRVNGRLVAAAYRHPELGNWGKALQAAGLDPEEHRRRRRWSRDRIVKEIQGRAARGESPAFGATVDDDPGLVAAACNKRHFGSWAAAVEAAGFDYDRCRRRHRWTREGILATIKQLHADGALLSTSGLKRSGWASLVATAAKPSMFGSWRDAVECAGIDYEEVRRASLAAARRDRARREG